MFAICTKEQKRDKMNNSHFWKQNPELSDLINNEFFKRTQLSEFMESAGCILINDLHEFTEKEFTKLLVNCILGTTRENLINFQNEISLIRDL